MPVATAHDDRRKIVTRVIRRVTKVAADYDRGVVQQSAVPFLNLIQIAEELVEMPHDVHLDAAEFFQRFLFASVVG